MLSAKKRLPAGTRVKVIEPMSVPAESTWETCQRTSTSVKKRLQQMFFNGDKRISGQIVFVSSETEKVRLARHALVKVELRDAAGSMIVITAPSDRLRAA
jgi:hypothetical protein